MDEFDDIEVEDKLHIIVSVKDFRGILSHAQMTSGELSASYSNPGRPMKLSYSGDGILCDFILMTVGEKEAGGPKPKNSRAGAAKGSRPTLEATSTRSSSIAGESNARSQPAPKQKTPVRPRQSQFEIRPPPLPPPSTLRSESLFVPQGDNDTQWEPMNPDEDEEGDVARLEWDASNNQVSI
jgi:cell cycle checkpoint control protein RAD9A